MELKLNNEVAEKEIVYYILSLMVFLSSFYISVNLLIVNLVISVVLFDILVLAASVYIFNIRKYSLFKYDLPAFLSIFYIFSLIYLITAVRYVQQEQYKTATSWAIIFGIVLVSLNYIILCIKLNSLALSRGLSISIILISYSYVVVALILSFSWMYISDTKSSINGYVGWSFESTVNQGKYVLKDYLLQPKDYLFYERIKNPNIFARNEFTQKQIGGYIKARFAPVDKIEDFVLYSAENCFGGINVGIAPEGVRVKYKLVIQKFLFLMVTLVTVVNLGSKWRE